MPIILLEAVLNFCNLFYFVKQVALSEVEVVADTCAHLDLLKDWREG